ncbi:MAG: hypothetical protein OXI59_02490 [Gemmatimonadota bacterium]|nr:hypothetical protein [Gemmatimonadota bacterium]
MAAKNMVVLFDESGTPTIKDDPRTDWFLGVGIAYEQSAEKMIFSRCKDACGLANSRPLKNDRIENSRAVCITKLLADLPVSIFVSHVNTVDPKYREIIVAYERFGNKVRESRQVGERPIAQIIHSNILSHCLFHLVTGYFEQGGDDAAFSVFIDNWSISPNDIDISLSFRSESLYESILSLHRRFPPEGQFVSIKPLELLTKDSSRKRFVDVVASIFSRAYLKKDNQRYSCEAADILRECGKASCSDATQYLINFMQTVMQESQN